MIDSIRSGYYTFLFRNTPNINRMRQLGCSVYYVSPTNKIVSARVPSKKRLNRILADPNLRCAEKDCQLMLPQPKVKKVFSRKSYRTNSPSFLVKADSQLLTWNVARVLGGRPRPNDGKHVKVGVIDTGIDLKHPDLAANVKGGVNLVNPTSAPQDDNGHGSHVAGIIGAVNNGRGVVGVAGGVSLYAIKVLNQNGTGTLTTLIKGIEWGIRHNMHILNISVSGGQTVPVVMRDAIHRAVRNGIVVVASAGNHGDSQGKGDTVQMPGRLPNTIAVAALDRNNQRAPFSSTGPSVDIAAPGVNILSTFKDGRYASLSGTSMAAPHVSGAAAILKRRYPKVTPLQVKQILQKHAIDLPPKGVDRLTGAGLVQVR